MSRYMGQIMAECDCRDADCESMAYCKATRIRELQAELAYYKGVHDGIYSTGTHVVVERTLLDECEQAFQEIINSGGSRGSVAHAEFVDALSIRVLHKLRAQEKDR